MAGLLRDVDRAPVPSPGPQVQRAIHKADDTELNPKLSNTSWKALTGEQRTQAYRMMNDYYRVYKFRDAAHFYAYLDGTEAPTDVDEFYRRQAKPTALGAGTGRPDPYIDNHETDASGGFAAEEKKVGLGGAPRHSFLETRKHSSNWASFVELHHEGAVEKLETAGKYVGAAKATIEKLYAKAIHYADVMDKQEVTNDEKMVASTDDDVWGSIAIARKVNKMWDTVSTELAQSRALYAKAVLPIWGQLNQGMGSRVAATFRSGVKQSIVVGSAAETKLFMPPWLAKLRQRLTMDARSLYVEGHLLNDHLGGPAAAYNLVPLTENANHTHLYLVESVVKNKVLEMLDEQALDRHGKSPLYNPIERIEYSVVADYSGFPLREGTSGWIRAYNFLSEVIDALPTIKPAYTDAMTVEDFRKGLQSGVFGSTKVDGKQLDLAETWAALQKTMNVVAWDRSTTTLKTALDRIDTVSELWIEEERYVPTALVCNSKTVRQDGSEDDNGKMTDVRVPNGIGYIRLDGPVRE